MIIPYIETIIKLEEGLRLKPYYCSEGYPTIGYGQKIGNVGDPLPNVTTTEKEALQFLRDRVEGIYNQLSAYKPRAFLGCNDQQRAILISMAYQLGITGLLKFNKMWLALENKDYQKAAIEMLDSKWAKQTPNRAKRHFKTMLDGQLDTYYISNGELK